MVGDHSSPDAVIERSVNQADPGWFFQFSIVSRRFETHASPVVNSSCTDVQSVESIGVVAMKSPEPTRYMEAITPGSTFALALSR